MVLLLLTAAAGFTSQPAISEDLFEDIGASAQIAITRICQPLQFFKSSQAYRACLLQQLKNINPSAEPFFRQLASLNAEQGTAQNTAASTSSAQTQTTAPSESNAATTTEPATLPAQPSQLEPSSTPNPNTTNDLAKLSTTVSEAIAPWLEKIPGKPLSLVLLPLALLILLLTAIALRLRRKASARKRVKIAEAKATFQLRPDPAGKPAKPNTGTATRATGTSHQESPNQPRHPHDNTETTNDTGVSTGVSTGASKGVIASAEAETVAVANTTTPSQNQVSESELAIFETSRHGFENWLSSATPQRRREMCSELFILTMAYTDNRFDPELKKRIFKTKERDANTLIKRWAFKHDSQALAYAIRVFQTDTNKDQRSQFIDLLMALLVTEKALTPVQNNFLRFLSDAFGMGREQLERQYLRAFGEQMPSMPRPDKLTWWEPIDEETLFRWDAQSVALQPTKIRYLVLLGLPLQGKLDQESMLANYRRAVGRCHRERVNQLGEFEQELLTTRRKQFELARDALMEITA